MAGEPNGTPILKDSRHAARQYSLDTPGFGFTSIPRSKYLFGVNFILRQGINDSTLATDRELPFVVKYIDRPRLNFQLEEANQYNKARLVQTKVQYQPITMRFYDTTDDKVLRFFKKYFQFYFGEINNTSVGSWAYDITREGMLDNEGNGWGYSLSSNPAPRDSYWISHMELYHFFGGRYTKINFVHPKIESFDHDSNDYENGATGTEITMVLKYEGIIYAEGFDSGPIKITSGIAEKFGLDQGSTLETLNQEAIGPNEEGLSGLFGDKDRQETFFKSTQTSGVSPAFTTNLAGTLSSTSNLLSTDGSSGLSTSALNRAIGLAQRQGASTDASSIIGRALIDGAANTGQQIDRIVQNTQNLALSEEGYDALNGQKHSSAQYGSTRTYSSNELPPPPPPPTDPQTKPWEDPDL